MRAARWVTIVALLGVAASLPVGALGSSLRAAANSQTYTDSTGEDPSAPDITTVVVSNTDAGAITFKINISNRPVLTPDMSILVYLNTDQQTTTGDPNSYGADDVIELDPGSVFLFSWNGTTYTPAASQSSLSYSYDASGATIRINASDLNKTKSFGFVVEAISGLTTAADGTVDITNAHVDFAPDAGHGLWSYDVRTKLILTRTAFITTPTPARAGARFAASLAVAENDTNGPITDGTVTCTATVKGKRLRATHSLGNGVASCYWRLPKTAKGKTLYGTVTVTLRGATISKSFAVRVR